MEWSRKKDTFLNVLGTRLRSLSSNRNKNRNSYLSLDSHIRIPILLNTINVTQASTQTPPINFNNNAESERSHKSRRRKYQRRFNKCLTELMEKYPPIPPHDYLSEYRNQREDKSTCLIIHENDDSKKSCYSSLTNQNNNFIRSSSTSIDKTNQNISNDCEINSSISESIWSKLLESREDLSRLNKTLEYLDKRLEHLSININSSICSKCKQKKSNSNLH